MRSILQLKFFYRSLWPTTTEVLQSAFGALSCSHKVRREFGQQQQSLSSRRGDAVAFLALVPLEAMTANRRPVPPATQPIAVTIASHLQAFREAAHSLPDPSEGL